MDSHGQTPHQMGQIFGTKGQNNGVKGLAGIKTEAL
jgi:hypothetical protein